MVKQKKIWCLIFLSLLLTGISCVTRAETNTLSLFLAQNDDAGTVSSKLPGSDIGDNPAGTQSHELAKKDCSNLGYEITLFTPCSGEDATRLWRQTKILMIGGIGVAAFIALLPEDLSGWEKGTWERGQLLDKWKENVKAGPVWDRDKWYINYIGHPYFGGVYYQAARKSGYNQWNSFTYSFLMSTFYWEYGLEAFAETPSIQDLVVTPVGGWVYGEWAHNKEKEIRRNGNLAMGSEFWGSVALFLLDPVGVVDDWCCASKEVEVTALGIMRWPVQQYSSEVSPGEDYWGVRFAMQF
jgi:hypothetical protein